LKAEISKQKAKVFVGISSFLLSAFCLLLFSSCATTAPAPALPHPEWSAIPTGVVDSFCKRLHDDAIALGGELAIVTTTQPLATTTTMTALSQAYFKRADARGAVEAMADSHGSIPVAFAGSVCPWKPISGIDPTHRDMMIVELSSPLANPYVHNEAGLFARVSLGGNEASWYWIPLVQRGGAWSVGHITPLATR